MIKKITVKNFRNFEDSEIILNKGLNIFVGANSSGKTNLFALIKFINYLLESGDIDRSFNKVNGNFVNTKRFNETAQLSILFGIGALGIAQFQKDKYGVIQFEELDLNLKFKQMEQKVFLNDFNATLRFKYEQRNTDSKAKPKGKIHELTILNNTEFVDFFDLIYEVGMDAKVTGKREKLKKSGYKYKSYGLDGLTIDENNNDNFKKGFLRAIKPLFRESAIFFLNINPIEARKPVSIFESKPNMLSENGDNLAIYLDGIFKDKDIKDKFNEIITVDLPFISSIDTFNESKVKYTFIRIYEGEGNDIEQSWISDGTIDYIAYLSVILGVQEKKSTILCIEEIERNLHFKLLSSLISRFKEELGKKGVQIFITTHSMNLLNALNTEEVFILKRCKNLTKVTNISKVEKIKELLEIEPLGNLFYDNEIDYE